jgi:hypothetical protein
VEGDVAEWRQDYPVVGYWNCVEHVLPRSMLFSYQSISEY